jgi:hypothetical protein
MIPISNSLLKGNRCGAQLWDAQSRFKITYDWLPAGRPEMVPAGAMGLSHHVQEG